MSRILALTIAITAAFAAPGYAQPAAPAASAAAEISRLQDAAKLDMSAALMAQLSRAYATANQPRAALKAIEGALALEPANPEYLQARATLATWVGRYDQARNSYQQLARIQPPASDVTLNYARVSAWAGDTDTAATELRKYLTNRPEAADVWIELARVESWRGNYAAALSVLDHYRRMFGESANYQHQLAAVLAFGGRPSRAETMLEPLLAAEPNDDDLNLMKAVVFAKEQRTREAYETLDAMRTRPSGAQSIRTAERVMRAELASTAESQISLYCDSDQLSVQRFAPAVTLALHSGTRLLAGYERTQLEAAVASGLEQFNGATTALVEHLFVGASQSLGRMQFGAQVGHAQASDQERATYTARIRVRPVDTLVLSAERMDGLFVISPRTVGLGITQVAHRVQAEWSLGMRYHVAADVTHQTLSDGNERLEITVSPRRAVARRSRFNLDLGVSAQRLETSQNLDNGYYDPRRYEQYLITAFPYFKLQENVGLAVSAAGGAQRDNRSPSFHFGGTVGAEATFGIYAPWLLRVNSSATINQSLESGAFRGFGASVALVRRF
jgi:Tfp pilus assembly protein PilF